MPNTRKILETLFPKRIRKIAAPAILLLVNLYLYANSAALFGQQFATQWQVVFLFYVLMALGAAAIAPFLFQKSASAPITWQIGIFIGLSIGVFFATALLGFSTIGSLKPSISFTNILPALALEISTGGTEEVFFRGALGEKTGPVISIVAFAAWHAAAYNLDFVQIIVAGVMGAILFFIWYETKDRFGNSINGAVHVGLNLAKILPLAALL